MSGKWIYGRWFEGKKYRDTPGEVFYECPKCFGEYLETFLTEENGEVMCIDCWTKYYDN